MTRYQDDFYDAINGEWQKTAEIPADKSQTGGFVDLDQEIEDLMLATTDKWLTEKRCLRMLFWQTLSNTIA